MLVCVALAMSWQLGSSPEGGTTEWRTTFAAPGGESLIPRHAASIMHFQPQMPLPTDALVAATNCPHTFSVGDSYSLWNDTSLQWPGRDSAGPPPADGTDVLLPSHTTILVTAGSLQSSTNAPYGRITVPSSSRLIFDDAGADGIIALDTLGLMIHGVVQAGAPGCRLLGRLNITLHGESQAALDGQSERERLLTLARDDPGLKGIVVANTSEARLDLHGALFHPTWTRLAAHVPGAAQETAAPAGRNSVLYLQECVNWRAGQRVLVTTTHHKDVRGYHFNEERAIGAVKCVEVEGEAYGQLTLSEPLAHYHHVGAGEYQAEVALLSRHIVVRGNEQSEPTDQLASPQCDAAGYAETDDPEVRNFVARFDQIPCAGAYLTGFGGHVLLGGSSRLAGVELWRMGMTNVLGRYPVHFHRNPYGDASYATDCAVHRSFYRAFVVHDTQATLLSRNVAFDVDGHAFYLESGVEELNTLEHNLAAHVHCIDGPFASDSRTRTLAHMRPCAYTHTHTSTHAHQHASTHAC